MALKFGSTTVTKVVFVKDGVSTDIKTLKFGGTTVFTSSVSGDWTVSTGSSRDYWAANWDWVCTGTSLGSQSGGGYTYKVTVPIYHSTSNTNSYTATVYLGASSGAETINCGSQSFTASGTYSKTVTSDTWLGNSTKIYVRVHVSNASYLTTNSGGTIKVTAST